jgi:hypothetical protein
MAVTAIGADRYRLHLRCNRCRCQSKGFVRIFAIAETDLNDLIFLFWR